MCKNKTTDNVEESIARHDYVQNCIAPKIETFICKDCGEEVENDGTNSLYLVLCWLCLEEYDAG